MVSPVVEPQVIYVSPQEYQELVESKIAQLVHKLPLTRQIADGTFRQLIGRTLYVVVYEDLEKSDQAKVTNPSLVFVQSKL